MQKTLPLHLQEIIYASSDSYMSWQISELERKGKIRKIASKIYSANLDEEPSILIRRNLFSIIGHFYPDALLSHRSALEFKPTSSGQLFLTYTYSRNVELGDVTLRFLKGSSAMEGDVSFFGIHVSQRERAFLENMQVSRKSGANSKTLSLQEIENRLEQIIRVNGEEALNKVRDRAREIVERLGMQKEFSKLNKIISALLTTHSSKILTSPLATARALGHPYDPARLTLFQTLFQALQQREFRYYLNQNQSTKAFQCFAFFESYFSNYIEGTVFEIEEAKEIIDSQTPLPARNEDSHDVLGAYQLVSNRTEMNITPNDAEQFIKILKYRHQVLMRARTTKNPGHFKDKNNFAGQTAFVDVRLVRGTLMKGFEYYQVLQHPFAKAAYMMFMISEVHPFLDGNGRVSRVMMNAELVKGGQSKIIIPNVFRDDYLGALRRLTRRQDPIPFIEMLSKAQRFSATIFGEDFDDMRLKLENSNAFAEHTEAKLRILKSI